MHRLEHWAARKKPLQLRTIETTLKALRRRVEVSSRRRHRSRTQRHQTSRTHVQEAQRGAAIEILNRVDGEAADREAARLRSAGS